MNIIFSKYRNTIFLLGILIFNLILGVFSLQSYPVGIDEPFSIFHAQMDINDIISNLKGGNNPPLYEIILHYWIKIFGISSLSVRFPSLIFSLLSIYFTYRIVVACSTRNNGFLTILLMSFSNYYLFFTHEARAYSMFLLLATLSMYLIILMSNRRTIHIVDSLMLTIILSLLLYSHYFGVFVIVFQSSYFLIYNWTRKVFIRRYLLILLGALIIYSPYLLESTNRILDVVQYGTWLHPVENLGNLHDIIFWFTNKSQIAYLIMMMLLYAATWKVFYKLNINLAFKLLVLFIIIPLFFLTSASIFISMPFFWRITSLKFYPFFFIILCVFLFFLLLVLSNRKNLHYFFIVGSFVLPLLIIFSISFYVPVFLDRYLIFIAPSFYIIISFSITFLFQKKYQYIIALLILCFMISSFKIDTNKTILRKINAGSMIEHIKHIKNEETKIIISPKYFDLEFAYHFNKEIFINYKNFSNLLLEDGVIAVSYGWELDLDENILTSSDNIIYVSTTYKKNGIIEKLVKEYVLIGQTEFGQGLIVSEFKNNTN